MDQLLSIGIKLICAKIVDLIDLVHKKRLDINSCQDETKCSHQEWIGRFGIPCALTIESLFGIHLLPFYQDYREFF